MKNNFKKAPLLLSLILIIISLCSSVVFAALDISQTLMFKELDYKFVHSNFVSSYKADGWQKATLDKNGKVTLYNAQNETISVYSDFLDDYLSSGWAFNKEYFGLITIYSPNGDSKEISPFDIDKWTSKGWSENKSDVIVTLYLPDGQTKEVGTNHVEEHKNEGWFTSPPVKIYSHDGSAKYVESFEAEKYIAEGWYTISFEKVKKYNDNFLDIPKEQWYYKEVASAYELGFIDGLSDTQFSPDTTVTVAQGITMASRVHASMNNCTIPQTSSENWYDSYVSYAKKAGFVSESQFSDYNAPLKRYQMAELFYDIMPGGYYDVINNVNYIPDVSKSKEYSYKIYELYNAGIFLGNDDYGTFYPDSSITRKECAAIINRVAIAQNRVKGALIERSITMYAADGRQKQVPESKVEAELSVGWYTEPLFIMYAPDGTTKIVLQSKVEEEKKNGWSTTAPEATQKTVLTAEEIYGKCSPSVFTIHLFDKNKEHLSLGSGFFINDSGVAITNYHVIDNCYYATAHITTTGKEYNIRGVYAYDIKNDWAVIQVDCKNNSYLRTGDKETIVGGAPVYALGSPEGFDGTLSAGIISNPARKLNNYTYIQTDASITHGNSGGPLLNKYGDVIGINTMGHDAGNLNFAVPVYQALNYSTDTVYSFSTLLYASPSNSHEELVSYIYKNGEFNTEIDCYHISETYENDEGIKILVVLAYFVHDDRIVIGSEHENINLKLFVPQKNNFYDFTLSFYDKETKNIYSSEGSVMTGYDLSTQSVKAVNLSTFTFNGLNKLHSSMHEAMEELIGSTIHLTVTLIDQALMSDTGFSINSIYNITE